MNYSDLARFAYKEYLKAKEVKENEFELTTEGYEKV